MFALELILSVGLAAALIYVALVDMREYRIPNAISYPLIAAGLALAAFLPVPSLPDRLIGAGAGFGVIWAIGALYRRYRSHEGIGLGDAKLTAAAGAWLGWQALPWILLVASVTGLLFAFWKSRRAEGLDLQERVAFGPFLAIGFWVAWLVRLAGMS